MSGARAIIEQIKSFFNPFLHLLNENLRLSEKTKYISKTF